MLIKTVKLHQAPCIHRFGCKTSRKLKNCNLVHIFYMDSLDNSDIFCPYDLCCSFSNHEKSSHNTILDCFGHAYLCDSHTSQLDLMFMKHYAPNRCLYIKVAKLRTGVGSAKTSYLQNYSVKLFKEHFKVQIFKER